MWPRFAIYILWAVLHRYRRQAKYPFRNVFILIIALLRLLKNDVVRPEWGCKQGAGRATREGGKNSTIQTVHIYSEPRRLRLNFNFLLFLESLCRLLIMQNEHVQFNEFYNWLSKTKWKICFVDCTNRSLFFF